MIMRVIFGIILICQFYPTSPQYFADELPHEWRPSAKTFLLLMQEIIQAGTMVVNSLYKIRLDNHGTPAYEVGYIVYNIIEIYRKMVDRYNITVVLGPKLYVLEYVMYLQDIEKFYWELDHITNMLYETEKKYKVKSHINATFVDVLPGVEPTEDFPDPTVFTPMKKKKRKQPFNVNERLEQYKKEMLHGKTTTTKRLRFPIEYGWDDGLYEWR